MEEIKCLNCQGDQLKSFVQATDFENPSETLYSLQQCKECELVFENPRPTLEELPGFYSNENYYSYIELEKKKNQKIGLLERLRHLFFEKTLAYYYGKDRSFVNTLCAWVGKGRFGSLPKEIEIGKILDIGCGDGVFLDVARKYGWEPYGVEINGDAAARANEAGMNVHTGDLISAKYESNQFDLIRMWSVLEHTPNPKEVLSEICRILKPSGVLILQVPNIRSKAFELFGPYWTGLDLPRHLVHFSPDTLNRSLESVGFDVEKISFSSVGTSWPSYRFKQQMTENKTGNSFVNSLLRIGNLFFDRMWDLFQRGDCMVAWARKSQR